jgi:ATP-dependent DNA ligase
LSDFSKESAGSSPGTETSSNLSLAERSDNAELDSRSVVLDGEIVCLDGDGKPQFRDLLFRREEPRSIAFDLLWLDRTDLRFFPLGDRKKELRRLIPRASQQLYLL